MNPEKNCIYAIRNGGTIELNLFWCFIRYRSMWRDCLTSVTSLIWSMIAQIKRVMKIEKATCLKAKSAENICSPTRTESAI